MSRTPLFAAVRKALAVASHEHGIALPRTSALSRRRLLKLDPQAVAAFFWATYPYTLGSYASAGVGQYTTFLDVAAEPAVDGHVQFAGEHTSSEFLGYMNGGVESGNRASAALIETLALKKE